ncbi:hypothetical protein [Halonatronum saccharophilum]|uniref:hypothetical protein n=1 Tax=Halonatronum saccharophilum TaxID=150060 RepID=UPI0004841AAF|nr:hypothetical protein [Halonatronum saccharophilum]
MNITKEDIIGFGKVLEQFGKVVQQDPNIVLDFISNLKQNNEKNNSNDEIDEEKLDLVNLFKKSNELLEENFIDYLSGFKIKELKYLLKKHHLGGSKITKKQKIIQHIVDNLSKRSNDVFREYKVVDEDNSQGQS